MNEQHIFELLHLVTKSGELELRLRAGAEDDTRLVGRWARNKRDTDTFCEWVLLLAKNADKETEAEFLRKGQFVRQLHVAIQRLLDIAWEELWCGAHPDRPDEAWEGEDFDLMRVWRKKAAAMFRDCGQGWVLELESPEDYIEILREAGASEQLVIELADWVGIVREMEVEQ